MVSDDVYDDFKDTCDQARVAAEAGDIEEARRLSKFTRDLLEEESNDSGTE
jgi:hypothetical protein